MSPSKRRSCGRSFHLAVIAVALALAGSACGKHAKGAAATKTIRVTGIPTENPTELARQAEPLVAYLEKRLGAKVEYVPVTDYGAAVQALAAGKVDFAWLGGFTYVQARNLAKVVPLCQRDIDRQFKSLFITSDPSIKSPDDLKGKTFAFGSKSSTSGHLMPRYFLTSQFKIDPDKDFSGAPVFSGAHDATAKMVESGKVQAGVLDMQVWQRMVNEHQVDTDKVKVFWTTPPFIDYLWTARADVPQATRDAFTKAFLDLDPSKPDDAKILALQGGHKYVPTAASDYDALEGVAKSIGLLTPGK